MDATPIPLETLLAHREWVRAVARAVVRDPNAADDVEQETWLAALQAPPRHRSSLRGWLGAVVRSRARRAGRGDSRRVRREVAVARGEATPSTVELAEIADTHRRVVQAVVALDEPYRATILLRYFEGLSVEDVAARTGAPLETARSRLKRGVGKLRERLARELGAAEDRPWQLALLPMLGATRETGVGAGIGATAAAGAGGVAMAASTKAVVQAAAVLVVLGVGAVVVPTVLLQRGEREDRGTVPVAAARARVAPVVRQEGRRHAATEESAADPTRQPDDAVTVAPQETKTARALTAAEMLERVRVKIEMRGGSLLDSIAQLRERTHVDIVIAQEAVDRLPDGWVGSLSLQDGSGTAALTAFTKMLRLAYVFEEPRVVVVPLGVERDKSRPVIVPPRWTPPPPVTVVGSVVDVHGVPVVGAEILESGTVRGTTDIAGRFDVKLDPPPGEVQARAAGNVASDSVAIRAASGAQVPLDLALRCPAGSVRVRVVCEARPLADAVVVAGPREDGNFKLADGRRAHRRPPWGKTDAQGLVTVSGVPLGETSVWVQRRGYEEGTHPVTVKAGETAEVELKLVEKPSLKERFEKSRVTCRFDDTAPRSALDYFSAVTKIILVLAPDIDGEAREAKLSMRHDDVPLSQALDDLCRQLGARYELHEENELVFIKSARPEPTSGGTKR